MQNNSKALRPIEHSIDWETIPQLEVRAAQEVGGALVLELDQKIKLTLSFAGGGIRFQIGVGTDWGIITGDLRRESGTLTEHEGGCSFRKNTGDVDALIEISYAPFTFRYIVDGKVVQQSGVDGHFSRSYRVAPLARVEGAWMVSLALGVDEGVYGLGEKWGSLNHRGTFVRSWNEDALGVNAEISYKNTPFAFGTEGWGYWVHSGSAVSHAVGFGPYSHRCLVIAQESECLDLFIWSGSGARVINQYCSLTGFASPPPLYSLGVILSRAFYRNPEELLSVAKEVRDRQFPCDVITLDGRAWQDTETRFLFEWDKKRYPNPKEVIDQLQALNFKVCNWEYPMVSIKNPRFQELEKKGYFLKDATTNKTYIHHWSDAPWNEVLTPLVPSAIIDFTHPEAYQFWLDEHRHIFDAGVAMLKPDFGEQVPPTAIASNGMRGTELHNAFSLLYNRCCWEAAQKYVGKDAFLFSRSAWSGSQRYPSMWGGDPQADYGGLAGSIRGALSWGLSGGPFFATDIGGFYGDTRDQTLYVRWTQMAIFSAHMRFHGIGEREPWSYGEEIYNIIKDLVQLRYRLIPYLQKAIAQSCQTGLPVQRAMVLACPEDRLAWGFDTQYFFGDSLLVVPCVAPSGVVHFYLPEGEWFQFGQQKSFNGSKVYSMKLDLNEFLVFAKRGTSIPIGPDVTHLADNPTTSSRSHSYWVAGE